MHILEEDRREGRGLSGNALGGHLLKAIRPLQWAASGMDNARRWLKALRIAALVMGVLLLVLAMMLEAYIVLDLDHPEWGLLCK